MTDPSCTIETVILYMDHRSDSWIAAARSALAATMTPCPVEIEIDSFKAQAEDLELEQEKAGPVEYTGGQAR